jgi:hypothetical protein
MTLQGIHPLIVLMAFSACHGDAHFDVQRVNYLLIRFWDIWENVYNRVYLFV